MARMKKDDMIEILVDQFGYSYKELKEKNYAEIQIIYNDEMQGSSQLKKKAAREARRQKIVKIDPEEMIYVQSNVDGFFSHTSDRYGNWLFSEYGQIERMPFEELQRINHRYRSVLTKPWILILEEDAIEQLGLEEVYEHVLMPDYVKNEFFELNVDEMRKTLEHLTEGMKEIIAAMAYKKYMNGTLTDLAKIKLIEEICKCTIIF